VQIGHMRGGRDPVTAILRASRMLDSVDTFYVSLLQPCFPERPTDDVALEVFFVFHLYRIYVIPGTLPDCPEATYLLTITQRHAASILAEVWGGDYEGWYWLFNTSKFAWVDYEMPVPKAIARLMQHPNVMGIEFEIDQEVARFKDLSGS
jgi:hypothetical protein